MRDIMIGYTGLVMEVGLLLDEISLFLDVSILKGSAVLPSTHSLSLSTAANV